MRRIGLGLAVWMAVVGALAIVALPDSPAGAARAPANPLHGRLSGVDFLTGYRHIAQDAAEFQRIRADGANTVSFDVWWQVPSYSSSVVAPVPGGGTDSDADLLTAAREAEHVGLKVTLTPKVVIGTGGWAGDYNPPDPAVFFQGFQTMTDHYASLAQQTGMSLFVAGSEMSASLRYSDYWRQIISSARQRFRGPVAHEVDWRVISQLSFGDAVDVVLLSAYFPLSNAESPTLADLQGGWHSYQYPDQSKTQDAFSQVAALAHRWNKPVIFGEVGYYATTHPAEQPWLPANRSWTPTAKAAGPDLQYTAYRALLDTFNNQPWWGGVLWWAWNDGDLRSPEGKPAEALIGGLPAEKTAEAASAGTPQPAYTREVAAVALGVLLVAMAAATRQAGLRRRSRPRTA